MSRDTLKMLHDAKKNEEPTVDGWPLYSGLPQPEPEPVAWMYMIVETKHVHHKQIDNYFSLDGGKTNIKGAPLYTAPPKKEWVGLTDDERDEIYNRHSAWVHAVEAKLKEKNT